MDSTFLQARITAIQAQVVAYESASLALAAGGIQSYKLDTGQSMQWVTKLDLDMIQRTLNSLYNQLQLLEYRLNGGNTSIGVPGW